MKEFGNIKVNKGEKIKGFFKVTNTNIKLPVTIINGN